MRTGLDNSGHAQATLNGKLAVILRPCPASAPIAGRYNNNHTLTSRLPDRFHQKVRNPVLYGFLTLMLLLMLALLPDISQAGERHLAYLVSDQRIPFWDIMHKGVVERATQLGYRVTTYSAENSAKRELKHTARAIQQGVDGIILSPTNSSASVIILKLAKSANIPVVIADIGTEGGEYVSYIASDNREGSYQIGGILVNALQARNWDQGTVGIISIPQTRENGRARTAGFMRAMDEAHIRGAGIRQQVNFSYRETYDFARQLIEANPDLRALWLQGSDRYQAALDAMADTGRQQQMLLICFDAEPEFLELIPKGVLVGAAMQQPFLMGESAVNALHEHLQGGIPQHQILLPILAVSKDNIELLKPKILRNVLGIGEQ